MGEEGDGNEVRLSAAVAGLLGCPLRGAVEKRERERGLEGQAPLSCPVRGAMGETE